MGQYHKTFNLDKKQFINPHRLGDGLKLLEQCGWSPGGTNDALHMLLAACSGRGGGDFQSKDPIIGSWAGDRIAVIGGYAEPDDVPGCNAPEVYEAEDYEDITEKIKPIMEQEYEVVYGEGEYYCKRVSLFDIKGCRSSYGCGDRVFEFTGGSVKSSVLRSAVKEHLKSNQDLENFDVTPLLQSDSVSN